MTISDDQLNALIRSSESHRVERKSALPNAAELRKALVAFANSLNEGEFAAVVIGVANDGTVIGIDNVDETQRKVRQIAQQDCYPAITCEPRVLPLDSKEVVAVVVPWSVKKPHFAGPAWVRRGSESVRASDEVYEDLIASRNDKARRILAWKGKLVSVRFLLGGPVYASQSRFDPPPFDRRDYRIENCSAHDVTFIDEASGTIRSKPLERLTVCFDVARNRLQLEIDDHP